MATHIYDNFGMKPPTVGPDGSVFMTFVETDEDGNPQDSHVFPMSDEAAKEFHKVLGETLGQRIDVANMQDLRRETTGVPQQPRR